MNVTREDVYKVLEDGGKSLDDIRRALGIPEGKKGTRYKICTILNATRKAGYVRRTDAGTYELTGKRRMKGVDPKKTDAKVRGAIGSGVDTVYEIADTIGVSPETVRASLRRMGAVKERDGLQIHWRLPE